MKILIPICFSKANNNYVLVFFELPLGFLPHLVFEPMLGALKFWAFP
jgi:hypothetical protein